jgi:hypothetical protein
MLSILENGDSIIQLDLGLRQDRTSRMVLDASMNQNISVKDSFKQSIQLIKSRECT